MRPSEHATASARYDVRFELGQEDEDVVETLLDDPADSRESLGDKPRVKLG